MAKDARKKVSFDLYEIELETVRNICKRKKMKLVDFFRDAVKDKIDKENKYMTIYLIHKMSIKELTLRSELYEVELKTASDEMKKNVAAEQEGTISLKENFREIIGSYSKADESGNIEPIIFFDDEALEEIITEIGGDVPFFTKERY